MDAKDLVLNIAVNMGRVSRWAMEKKEARISQFMDETEKYLKRLDTVPVSNRFNPTLISFKKKFLQLKRGIKMDEVWAEDALTWANILQHRAKLV